MVDIMLSDEVITNAEDTAADAKDIFVMPTSYAQQRLWFLQQLEPNSTTLNIPVAMRLIGPLNIDALAYSFNEVIHRHEILRTTFDLEDGEPVQVITPPVDDKPHLRMIDLSAKLETEREAEVNRLFADESHTPFDLATGPLFRFFLIKLGAQEHVLVYNMHHIVSDGGSIEVLYQELADFYTAFESGQQSSLPALTIQYADFSLWQREWLQTDAVRKQSAYWADQLGGDLPTLELPTDYLRPAVQTYTSNRCALTLSPTLSKALRSLSQQTQSTLFMTMLTAFKTLLYRYSGQTDVTVGSPIANRNRPEIEPLIGCFLNSLVLRTQLSETLTFRQFLSQVRQVTLDGYNNQDVPFEHLLEKLQPERDLSRTPLFQVFFNMLNKGSATFTLPHIKTEFLAWAEIGSKFDITLYVQDTPEHIELKLVYNADLFSSSRMAEMLAQFDLLLSQIVTNPDQKLAAYSLVTTQAQPNLPDPIVPLDTTWHGPVHEAFSKQAQRIPTHTAVADDSETWTYEELNAASNQLAHYLRNNNIQSEDIIAIYGHRNASLVWAIMGVLKAGGTFLILDPAYPTDRLIEYVRLAKPRGWLQIDAAGEPPAKLLTALEDLSINCQLSLPNHSKATEYGILAEYSAENLNLSIGADDLACVTFTSGSTGTPKAVMGRHGSLSHFLPWQQQTYNLSENDRFTMLSGLAHDPLQRDIFTALWVGGKICIPNPGQIGKPGWLAQWLHDEAITITNLTPAMSQLITDTIASDNTNGASMAHQIKSLRLAFFIGDVLTQRHISRLKDLAPNIAFINLYGATETQRAFGYMSVNDNVPHLATSEIATAVPKEIIPLGKGMPDVQLLIMNNFQELAGIGELGEIYVRSPHLARGYLDDPALTQTKFLQNPFTDITDDRLYRTGDLGRYLSDGTVEFTGRADNQVQIRGYRIELGEIEAALSQHQDVQTAVVAVYYDEINEPFLTAYIVPDSKQNQPDIADIRQGLRSRFPQHMIPAAYVMLDALPLTPNGKLDRKALPAPDPDNQAVGEGSEGLVAPRDEVEAQLLEIWQSILPARSIGIQDDFFDLGGHSLLAVSLFAKIESVFDKSLPLATLFQAPTIAAQADILRQDGWMPAASWIVPVQPKGSKPPFFCVTPPRGSVVGFSALSRHLGEDQPFYGLQIEGAVRIGGKANTKTHDTPEVLAKQYVTAIRSIQPNGPYFIGGRCFGAYVAYEIAQQLYKQGEKVALLAIVAARPTQFQRPRLHYLRRLFYHMRQGKLQHALNTALPAMKRKYGAKFQRRLQQRVPSHQKRTAEPIANIAESSQQKVVYKYRQTQYPGKITVFQTSDVTKAAWSDLAAEGVDFHVIPGTHIDIFREPNVRQLASILSSCLK